MTVGSIGQSGNIAAASASYSPKTQKGGSASVSSNKDTAILSQKAKELAASQSGKSAQEEASESASEKLTEQVNGGN